MTPHPPSRVSSRPKPLQSKDQKFWEEADYSGPHSKDLGGTNVRATIGPGNSERQPPYYKGSGPDNTQCSAVKRMNEQGQNVVRGHILNDNIGGKGERQNLTPMHSDANGNYEHHVESHMKEALRISHMHDEGNRNDTHFYGIEFQGKVIRDGSRPNKGDPAYADHVDVSANYVRKHKITGQIESINHDQLPPRRPGQDPWPHLQSGRFDPENGGPLTPLNNPMPSKYDPAPYPAASQGSPMSTQ